MNPRAIVVFAESVGIDLARRRLPKSLCGLFYRSWNSDSIPGATVYLFTSGAGRGTNIHSQNGTSFGERLENAISKVAEFGHSELVVIGSDCPQLRLNDIDIAFDQLRSNKLVLGPDHRGGCYLIGLRIADRNLLHGICWKRNTDRSQLQQRCGREGVFLLPVKYDLDTWSDVQLFARLGDSLSLLAEILLSVLRPRFSFTLFVDLAAHFARVRQQLPPPVFAY